MRHNIHRALSIDEIKDRTAGYDLVLTADTPLADALNSRITSARLGKLAYTPRGLVYSNLSPDKKLKDRRELFLALHEKLNLSAREVLYHLENVLNCWQETGDPERIFDYQKFTDEATSEVVKYLLETPNMYRALSNFDSPPGGDVAVVAPHQFKQLDRAVLPDRYDVIKPLTEGDSFELPAFCIYSGSEAMVQTVLTGLDKYDPTDVAVVLHSESSYQSLLEASLRARNVPYSTNPLLSENPGYRSFLTFLKTGLERENTRVREVAPLLRKLGFNPGAERREEIVKNLEDEDVAAFRELSSSLAELDFRAALQKFRNLTPHNLEDFEGLLEELNLSHSRINRDRLDFLEFYMDNFPPPLDEKSQPGVLLASPRTSSFIDRPVVFYLGLGVDWGRELTPRPWYNPEEHRNRSIKDFSLLLQNGQQQYFLVQNRRKNETVTPCYYFNSLLEQEFEEFADLNSKRYRPEFSAPEKGFEPTRIQPSERSKPLPENFSQSSLNLFASSPRAFLFDRLLPDQQNRYLVKGTLFHDFAEFYLDHPEFVKKQGLDELARGCLEKMKLYVEKHETDRLLTEFQLGFQNLVYYLDSNGLTVSQANSRNTGSRGADRREDNFFGNRFDLPLKDSRAEVLFHNDELGIRGKIDLLLTKNRLVDYKSGRRQTPQSLVRRSSLKFVRDRVDFQPILYLAQRRHELPEEKLSFSFFYFLDSLNDILAGGESTGGSLEEITYHPVTFAEKVPRKDTFDYLVRGVAETNNRRKTLEKLGHPSFRDFFKNNQFPETYDRDELRETRIYENFLNLCLKSVGDYSYVRDGVGSAFNKLLKMRKTSFFKEDLDEFEDYVAGCRKQLADYKQNRFPVDGDLENFDLDDLPARDLILRDSGGT